MLHMSQAIVWRADMSDDRGVYPPRRPGKLPELADKAARSAALMDRPYLSEIGRALTRHWIDIAGDNLVPAKQHLRPELIPRTLPHIFMYEYHSPDNIQFRVAGALLREVHGRELTGTSYMDMMSEPARSRASKRLFGMVDQPCGLHVINRATFASGSTGDFRSYGLPLLDRNGQVRFSIHITEYIGEDQLPYNRVFTDMAAIHAEYVDIGAGIPDFAPPF